MKIKLKNVRLSFPALFEPKTFGGSEGEPKYSANFLMAPTHPSVKEVEEAMRAVAIEKWGQKGEATLLSLKASGKTCLKSGDTKEYDGYEGMLFLSASSTTRPLVVDRNPNKILVAGEGIPYGGCYVDASIDIWAMDNQFGRRIAAGLRGVQFRADGDAFGAGGPAKPDEFESIEGEENDDLV